MATTLTAGTPWRVIAVFSVPLLIGNVVQQLYQVADAAVVGRTLGVDALAAVGATGSLMFLVIGSAWGLGNGFAIPTAHAFGAGDHAGVRRSFATGIVLVAVASVIVTVGGPLLVEPALIALQTPPELLAPATAFAQVSLLGGSALLYFNYLAAVIRSIGDSRTPLVFLTISCLINVVLVIVMVVTLDLGIAGAALATVVAQALSAVLCVIHIARRVPVLHIHRPDWRITRHDVARHLRLGIPMGFQMSIIAISTLAVQVRLNEIGSDAVAAATTAARVDGLAIALLQSLGLAASMYVAQNLGARKLDRIRQGVRQALVLAVISSVVLGGVVIAIGRPLLGFFVEGATDVIDLAMIMLIVSAAFYVVLSVLFILRGAIQGLGLSGIPTVTGVVELVMRFTAALLLGALFGFVGVAWNAPLAWIGATVILIPAWVHAVRRLPQIAARAGLEPVDLPTVTAPISIIAPTTATIDIIPTHDHEDERTGPISTVR